MLGLRRTRNSIATVSQDGTSPCEIKIGKYVVKLAAVPTRNIKIKLLDGTTCLIKAHNGIISVESKTKRSIEVTGEIPGNGLRIESRGKVTINNVKGKKLVVSAADQVNVEGTLTLDELSMKSRYIYSKYGSVANLTEKLVMRGHKTLILGTYSADEIDIRMNIVSGLLWGKISGRVKVHINSLITTFALGARAWSPTVIVNTGFYFNLLAWVAAHNFVSENFVPLDFGLTTPYIPTSRKEFWAMFEPPKFPTNRQEVGKFLLSYPRFWSTFRSVLNFIYKPLGLLIGIFMRCRTIYNNSNKISAIYEKHAKNLTSTQPVTDCINWLKNADSEEKLDCLNAALAAKNISYAIPAACTGARAVVAEYKNTDFKIPQSYAETKTAVQENWQGFFISTAPAFVPLYIIDGWRGVRAGWTYTGGEIITATKIDDSRNYTVKMPHN